MEKEEADIIELTEENIESMVYTIRGVKVMLDFDLARIYGYETRAFNQQVKNNIEKFPPDFMFQLTAEEVNELSRCQNVTTIKSPIESEEITRSKNLTSIMQAKGTKGGRTYRPYAFTEQGIYMLMTVLKGELAVQQSIKLVRLFKGMKDYIAKTKNIIDLSSIIELTNQVNSNTARLDKVEEKIDVVMDYFVNPSTHQEFIILNGQRFKADLAYQQIYSLAKHSVLIIDDYIDIKTLNLLRSCKEGVSFTICSDNKAKNKLNDTFIGDFTKETGLSLTFKKNNGVFHDRYIVIDYKTDNEMIYLCGASSKDAGKKVTTIIKIGHQELYHPLIEKIVG